MIRPPMVYVAGPISADPLGGTRAAIDAAARMLAAGLVPIVPHLSILFEIVHPQPYERWLAYDFELIRRCDHLYRIEGVSPGADAEVEFARGESIPVWLPEHGTLADFLAVLA